MPRVPRLLPISNAWAFLTRKEEDYKYTEVGKYFAPDFGLNLNRLEFPVNPYEVFKCDVSEYEYFALFRS